MFVAIRVRDYIPDRHLVPMLRGWRELLNTKYDCWRIFEEAGFDIVEMMMSRDATETITNFVSTNKRLVGVRFDAAQRDR